MDHLEDYEGTITAICKNLCTIEVDHTYTVHTAFLYQKNNLHTKPVVPFPIVEGPITLKNVKTYSTHMIITNDNASRIICKSNNTKREYLSTFLSYLNFISKHKLDAFGIIKVHDFLSKSKNYNKQLNIEESTEVLLCGLLDALIEKHLLNLKDLKLTIYTPSNLNPVYNFNSKLEWSYHSSLNMENSYIIGKLSVNKIGRLCITDIASEIPCIIINKYDMDMQNYLNEIIFVRRYVQFCEYYSTTHQNISYILFDILDMLRMNVNCKGTQPCYLIKEKPNEHECCISFQLIEKIAPTISPTGIVEQYLIIFNRSINKIIYLCLEWPLLSVVPLLEINSNYDMFVYNGLQNFKSCRHHLQNSWGYKIIGDDVLFYKSPVITDLCTRQIDKTLISVDGIILEKNFTNSLPSFRMRYPKVTGFNTPGLRTHGLKLLTNNNEKQYLYLNDWESLECPLALIPDMEIQIRNVRAQGTYLKSTDLTYFRITGFKLLPESRNLNISYIDENDFADDIEVPLNITENIEKTEDRKSVRFEANDVVLEEIIIDVQCEACSTTKLCKGNCNNCASPSNAIFKGIFTLKHENEVRIIVNQISLMNEIFGLHEFLWKEISENLESCKLTVILNRGPSTKFEEWLANAATLFNKRPPALIMDCLQDNKEWILKSVHVKEI